MTVEERVPTCREIVELITDYLEGGLALEERERFELHVVVCGACQTYIEQMRQTIRLAGKVEPDALSEETQAALVAAFRQFRR